jgi:Flp pilus assembly protein TadB
MSEFGYISLVFYVYAIFVSSCFLVFVVIWAGVAPHILLYSFTTITVCFLFLYLLKPYKKNPVKRGIRRQNWFFY